ncbi:MAG: T9SS type A sorting domain-containing protein, partial [Flavobacteriaceae bacterium]
TNVGTQDFATKGFSVYPNPVNNVMNLQANENISKVAIYNVLGQEVYSAKINAMTSSVDMSSMATGAYFVKVNINGTEGTVKVIK